MSKAMTIVGMVVAALVLLIFGMDFVTGIPFGVGGKAMHMGAITAAAILAYLSWDTMQEL